MVMNVAKDPNAQSAKPYKDKSKPADIRSSNIRAAKAVSDAIRTSLGPKGMDKMIQAANGEVTITNDGATILKEMNVMHPAAKMLVELSKAQDIETGDGTTGVVILAGSLLDTAERLLQKGIHPAMISEAFEMASDRAQEAVRFISHAVNLRSRPWLLRVAGTALNSKVVNQQSSLLAPLAVGAVVKLAKKKNDDVDLNNIKVIKVLGGTVEDTKIIQGLVLTQKCCNMSGRKSITKAKIGLIQFCISPPKTDMDHNVVVSDYAAMDRVLREERVYILNIVKQIKKSGCNVLLVQKSILRDAVSDLAIHFLDKMNIMVIKDIEREDIPYICNTLQCKPIASLDHFVAENLVNAELCQEMKSGNSKFVKITEIENPGPTVTIVVRGSNKLVLDEAARSLHDAMSVIRCLIKDPIAIPGGGAAEMEVALKMPEFALTLHDVHAYCVRAYGSAFEIIPATLAENAGMNPTATVAELRNLHAQRKYSYGIDVRKGDITDMVEEHVVQPISVCLSSIKLATETVRSILKIDDIVNTNQ